MPVSSVRNKKCRYRKLSRAQTQKGAGNRRNITRTSRSHHKGAGYTSTSKAVSKRLGLTKNAMITDYGTDELANIILISKNHPKYVVVTGLTPKVYYGLHINHHHLNKVEQVYIRSNNLSYSLRMIPMGIKSSDMCPTTEQYVALMKVMKKHISPQHSLMKAIDSKQADKPYVVYKVKTISNKSVMHTMQGHYYVLLNFKSITAKKKFEYLKQRLIKDENKHRLLFKKKIADEELLGEENGLPLLYSVEERIVRSKQSRQPIISGANYYLPFTFHSTVSSTREMSKKAMMEALRDAKFLVNQNVSEYRLVPIRMPDAEKYYRGTGLAMYRLDFANTQLHTEQALISFYPNYFRAGSRKYMNAMSGGGSRAGKSRTRKRLSKQHTQRHNQDGGGLFKNAVNSVLFPLHTLGKQSTNALGYVSRKLTRNFAGRKKYHLYFDPQKTNSYYIIIQKRGSNAGAIVGNPTTHHLAVVHERFMVKADYNSMFDRVKKMKKHIDQQQKETHGLLGFFKRFQMRHSDAYTSEKHSTPFGRIYGPSLNALEKNKNGIDTSYHFMELELTKGYKQSLHGIGNITPISLRTEFVDDFENSLKEGRGATDDFPYSLTNPDPLITNMENLMAGINTTVGDEEFTLPGIKKEYGQVKYLKHRLCECAIDKAIRASQLPRSVYKQIAKEFLANSVFCNIVGAVCKQWKRVLTIGKNIRYFNGLIPTSLLICVISFFIHELLLVSGIDAVGLGIEQAFAQAGVSLPTTGITEPLFMDMIIEPIIQGTPEVYQAVASQMANPSVAGGVGAGAVAISGIGVGTHLASQQATKDTHTAMQNARKEFVDEAVQEQEELSALEHFINTLDNEASKEIHTYNRLYNNPEFSELVGKINGVLGEDVGSNAGLQMLMSKQSIEHLRNLCNLLLKLHEDNASHQQLIRQFQETLEDHTDTIKQSKKIIADLQTDIATRKTRIETLRSATDGTNEEAMSDLQNVIKKLESYNAEKEKRIQKEQEKIDKYSKIQQNSSTETISSSPTTTPSPPQNQENASTGAPDEEALLNAGTPDEDALLNAGTPDEEALLNAGTPDEEALLNAGTPDEEALLNAGTPDEEALLNAGTPDEEALLNAGAPDEEALLNAGAPDEDALLNAVSGPEDVDMVNNVPQQKQPTTS